MQKYLYKDLYNLEEFHWWHIAKRQIVTEIIKKNFPDKRINILDVGCGAGKNLEEFSQFGTTWGLDNSACAIKFCRKRGIKNVKFGNAEAAPFPSSTFDLITLLDVLEHTDDNRTLIEMHRILKKDGLIIITVPAFSWLWSSWDEVLHHKKRYDKRYISDLLKSGKFHISFITYLYSFLVLPVLIIRRVKQLIFHNKNYPSDFRLSNNFLNKLMTVVSKFEFEIAKIISLPAGTSILVVAKK